MLNIHIIPCLDVASSRVVQRVNVVDLVDAGVVVGRALYDGRIDAAEAARLMAA